MIFVMFLRNATYSLLNIKLLFEASAQNPSFSPFVNNLADNISISLQLVSETECEKLLSTFYTGDFVFLEFY